MAGHRLGRRLLQGADGASICTLFSLFVFLLLNGSSVASASAATGSQETEVLMRESATRPLTRSWQGSEVATGQGREFAVLPKDGRGRSIRQVPRDERRPAVGRAGLGPWPGMTHGRLLCATVESMPVTETTSSTPKVEQHRQSEVKPVQVGKTAGRSADCVDRRTPCGNHLRERSVLESLNGTHIDKAHKSSTVEPEVSKGSQTLFTGTAELLSPGWHPAAVAGKNESEESSRKDAQSSKKEMADLAKEVLSNATAFGKAQGRGHAHVFDKDHLPIPGATVRSAAGAQALRKTLACHGNAGRWEFNPTPRKLPWPKPAFKHISSCDADRVEMEKVLWPGGAADNLTREQEWARVPKEAKWEWKMKGCALWEDFNYQRFCRVMNNEWGRKATVVFLGGEHMFALERRFFANMVAARPKRAPMVNLFPTHQPLMAENQTKAKSGLRYCYDVLAGDSVSVVYHRNRDLSTMWYMMPQGDKAVISAIEDYSPSVLVLSNEKTNISVTDFKEKVASMIKEIRRISEHDVLVVYMGAPSALQCTGPAQAGEARLENVTLLREVFTAHNAAAKEVVENLGGLFFDPNPALEAWATKDGKDRNQTDLLCVNGCLPGVVDAWVVLFQNVLFAALKGLSTDDLDAELQVDADNAIFLSPGPAVSLAGPRIQWWKSQMSEVNGVSDDEGVSTLEPYNLSPPDFPPKLVALVPGTRIRSAAEWKEAQDFFACQATKGRWVYNATPRALPWPRGPLTTTAMCDKDHLKTGGLVGEKADEVAVAGSPEEWKVREEVKWEWVADGACPIERFSREDLCRVLGPGRNIFIIGDSINMSFFHSLYNMLVMGVDLVKYPIRFLDVFKEWNIDVHESCHAFTNACADLFTEVVSVRRCGNDFLTLNMVPKLREAPWASKLKEWNPSIVYLNMGTHPVPDDVLLSYSKAALAFIRTTLPSAFIMWPALHPGHSNCQNFSGPIPTHQEFETLPYSWGTFPHQNELMRPMVAQAGAVWLDIEAMTLLRPDGHVASHWNTPSPDCLHYCRPGPTDFWVVLFYHTVKRLL
eukprot:TRINITY_DN4043_c0_g1_i3.p1 TRINITY_DN4043_c0_g1~~TRINITY_DN4043_c0_g1_i3.p1  ORF type:complete len:1047 (-),score=114.49 TRINITY_DN4043_c0_g1_i3:64-3204(-)